MRTTTGVPKVRVACFGQSAIIVGNDYHRIPAKVCALIVLVLEAPASRAEIADTLEQLWPGKPQEKQSHSLNQAFSTAHKLLGKAITRERNHIRICKADVDYDGFALKESTKICARSAVELYRGEFLSDLSTAFSDDFLDWRFRLAQHYKEVVLASLSLEIQNLVRKGLHENIRAFHQFIESTSPGLLEALPAIPEELLTPTAFAEKSVGTHPRFVGRHFELAAMQSAFQSASDGKGRTIIIRGEPGIGKTCLTEHFMATQVRGVRSIDVRAFKIEQHTPYYVLASVVNAIWQGVDATALPNDLVAAIAELCPELEINYRPLQNQTVEVAAHRRLFEAVYRCIALAARGAPLCIFLDDFQWVDDASLAGIAYLCRNIDNHRILVLACCRSDFGSRTTVENFWNSPLPNFNRIDLLELSSNEVREFIAFERPEWVRDDDLVNRIQSKSGGHPIFLHLALSVDHNDATSIAAAEQFLAVELSGLDPATRKVVEALAVAESPQTAEVIGEVINCPDEKALELAERAPFFVRCSGDGKFAVRHEVLSEIVLNSANEARIRYINQRFGDAYAHRSHSPAAIATFYHRAQNRRLAFEYSRLAAAEAEGLHALEEAAFFHLRSIVWSPSDDETRRIQTALADLYFRYGHYSRAEAAIRVVLEHPDLSVVHRLEWQIKAVETRLLSSKSEKPTLAEIRTLRDEATSVKAWRVLVAAIELEARGAHMGLFALNDLEIQRLHALLAQASTHVDKPTAISALTFLATSTAMVVRAGDGLQFISQAVPAADLQPETAATTTLGRATILYNNGLLSEALVQARHATRMVAEGEAVALKPHAANVLGCVLLELGHYEEAERVLSLGMAAVPDRDNIRRNFILNNYAWAAYNRGAYAECIGRLSEIEETSDLWIHRAQEALVGLSFVELGKIRQAFDIADKLEEHIRSSSRLNGDISLALILIARSAVHRYREASVADIIARALQEFENRDRLCWLRINLAKAESLARRNGKAAETICKAVIDEAELNGYVAILELGQRTARSIRRLNPLGTSRMR